MWKLRGRGSREPKDVWSWNNQCPGETGATPPGEEEDWEEQLRRCCPVSMEQVKTSCFFTIPFSLPVR